jgi:hypothetical protein
MDWGPIKMRSKREEIPNKENAMGRPVKRRINREITMTRATIEGSI